MTMNKRQQRALKALFDRGPIFHVEVVNHVKLKVVTSYLGFRRSAHYSSLNGCWMVPWAGMWIGIEEDGHTHS
jgi:hypothetical protein